LRQDLVVFAPWTALELAHWLVSVLSDMRCMAVCLYQLWRHYQSRGASMRPIYGEDELR
jgi:hypothetical protein